MGLIGRAQAVRAGNATVAACSSFYDRIKTSLRAACADTLAGKAALLAPGWRDMLVMAFPLGFDLTTVRRFLIPAQTLADLTVGKPFVFSAEQETGGNGIDFSAFFSVREWENLSEFVIAPLRNPQDRADDRFYLLFAANRSVPGRERLNLDAAGKIAEDFMRDTESCLPFLKMCAGRIPERKTREAAHDHIKSALDCGKKGYAIRITADTALFPGADEPFLTEAFYSALADAIGASNIIVNRTYTADADGRMEFICMIFSSSVLDLESYLYFLLKPMKLYFSEERVSKLKITADAEISSEAQIPSFIDRIFDGL